MPFVFAIGVTGHRKDVLAPSSLLSVHERLKAVLATIAADASGAFAENRRFYSPDPPRLLFVSPLADGSDQMAAEVALELGFELHAVLPFDRDRYRATIADDQSRARFDALLSRATCTFRRGSRSAVR